MEQPGTGRVVGEQCSSTWCSKVGDAVDLGELWWGLQLEFGIFELLEVCRGKESSEEARVAGLREADSVRFLLGGFLLASCFN